MSIINEALKKAGQTKATSDQAKLGFLANTSLLKDVKKKSGVNWGPVFVLMVMVLITGPLIAPIFSTPYRSTSSALLVPSYQETLSQAPDALGQAQTEDNRKAQFGIEEIPAAMNFGARQIVSTPQLPQLVISGIVYGKTDPYCLINGKVVKIGDRIEGGTVTAITQNKATVSYNGRNIDLWMNQ